MARKRDRGTVWAGRVFLLAALCAAASGGGAVSAEPTPGRSSAATRPPVPVERVPSRTAGIAAQDSWLGQ